MTCFSDIPDLKEKTMLVLMYSSGLCLAEVCSLRYEDIDRKQMRIYIQHAKNRSSRYAILSKYALDLLTHYWFQCGKPKEWLFPGKNKKMPSASQLPCPSILWGGLAFHLTLYHNNLMNVIQQMLKDHYEIIEYDLKPRPVVMENIDRVIGCGDPSFGGTMYGCPFCGNLKFVPFRCHSKFCPTCGSKYSNDRSTAMSFKLINCTHRHLVFTIDESLRQFFLDNRDLLNCLFESVSDVIKELFFSLNKSENFVQGFICVLHTFGRPLEWNPHIHCLLTEGGYSDDGLWRSVKYFNYSYLRKSFQTVLLNNLEKRIGSSFKKTKSDIYRKDKNGFYVYAKPNLCDPNSIVKYVSRYLGRPVIALSRIDSYDRHNVTFHYNRHEDNAFVSKTLPAIDFIKLLIQHIPEKNFKMTRYYGLYARHRAIDLNLHKAVHKSKHRIILDFNTWRMRFLITMGYDPLQCPNCKNEMLFLELYYKHERVTLEELYERTMRKHGMRPRSRSALLSFPSASYCIHHRWKDTANGSKIH